MRPLMKFFIYCTIIGIIAIIMTEAKAANGDLMGQEPPPEVPQEPPQGIKEFRTRRDVALQQGDEPDMPEEIPQEPPSRFRTKRQMPSPPDGVPQPPLPPM